VSSSRCQISWSSTKCQVQIYRCFPKENWGYISGNIKGKGMIQGVSGVGDFYELISHFNLRFMHIYGNKHVAPVELIPILKTLYGILITRDSSTHKILQALQDETMHDPREKIEIS
jgi:glycerol-3-phosphate dehydrogenase (NAD+)